MRSTGRSDGTSRISATAERARAVGAFYWQARRQARPDPELIKAYCFQDSIVQRMPSGELKFVVYINADHSYLPARRPSKSDGHPIAVSIRASLHAKLWRSREDPWHSPASTISPSSSRQ